MPLTTTKILFRCFPPISEAGSSRHAAVAGSPAVGRYTVLEVEHSADNRHGLDFVHLVGSIDLA